MKSGASVNAGTALTTLEYVLPLLDRVVLPVDAGGPADREPPPAAFDRVRILRENIDYHETGATIFAEGDLNPKDAARMLAMGANGIVIDRKDVLGVAPFEASLREFIDTATRARKTA